jgi:excisionase family DNA binding protein
MNEQLTSQPYQTYQPNVAAPRVNQGSPAIVLGMQETVQARRKLLMTVNEAAQCLSIGRPKMWQLVMTGEILSIKIGASRRIPVAALEGYVQQLCVAAEEEWQRRGYHYGTSR